MFPNQRTRKSPASCTPRIPFVTMACAAVLLSAARTPVAAQKLRASDARDWEAIASAEDARAALPGQLKAILDGARSDNLEMRRISIRALGRLQRPDLADTIAAALSDASPLIRAEAARALALATIADRAPNAVRARVRRALATEADPTVIGALAETLGRLRNANADSARIVASELSRLIDKGAAARLGAVRGMHFIVRQPAAIRAGIDSARNALTRVATARGSAGNAADADEMAIHARRLATETLALAGLASEQTALQILRDTDPIARREAVLIAGPQMRDTAAAHRIVDVALKDPFWLVRFEAMRQLNARLAANIPCSALHRLTRDTSMHVKLEAIDILGSRCVGDAATVSLLDSIATGLPQAATGEWHPAVHALAALAKRDAARANRLLPRFAMHPNLFVRTYAATAATSSSDTAMLRRLATDRAPNVRTAAVQGLHRIVRHAADDVYLAQLALDDGQLLMESAAALDSSKTPDVALKMLDALDRVTQPKRENSRDGRMALLNAIGHTGSTDNAGRLLPYLRDFDPTVAARAAAILKTWGRTDEAAPQPLPNEPVPTFAEANALAGVRLTVEMQNGDVFTLKLLPFDAPTNAARFARLAKSGYFNGLTLHRVEPNFVVQGGSPNANEYAGAPRFSRDEIGVPNNRGTVGLSTRGHDTGDAQLFINTIDNTQLDPLYTVFALVTSGMSAVDRILEGAAIRSITIR